MKYTDIFEVGNQQSQNVFKGFYGSLPLSTDYEYTPGSRSTSYEKMIYIKKISFPNGFVNFSYSDRIDKINDKKIDKIEIKNIHNKLIKEFNFNYGYFVSNQSENEIESILQGSLDNTKKSNRLKLVSIHESGKNPYIFNYDPVILPKKTSTAVDYWGFYNGKINNTSLAPNPSRLGFPEFGNNSNNKSADINYARACVLKEIIYPTGGKTVYEYELNEYSKASYETAVPNMDNIIGNVTKGFGIRVANIFLYDHNNSVSRKTEYSYSSGKSITPFEIRKRYSTTCGLRISSSSLVVRNFTVNEFHGSNFLTPSIVGSYNAVGYSGVSVTDVNLNDNNGRTSFTFINNRDSKPYLTDSNSFFTYGRISLPALSDINSTENGKLETINIFNKNNILLKKIEYEYLNKKSNIHYGTSITGFRSLIGLVGPAEGMGGIGPVITAQYLVGYYPIYGKHSLLKSEKITEFFDDKSTWSESLFAYNGNNILVSTTKKNEYGKSFLQEVTSISSSPTHTAKNILNLPTSKSIRENGFLKVQYDYDYKEINGITVTKDIKTLAGGNPANPNLIFYDSYDNYGNLLQFHVENDINTSIIWGYNDKYPIAKIENLHYSSIPTSTITDLKNKSNEDNDNCTSPTCKEEIFRMVLKDLQNAFPNATITTYTYDPLVGVTSVTDPKGQTVYYQYDEFNRLKFVKDQDENILSKNEYHYKN